MKHPFYFLLLTFLFSLFSHDVCATHIIGGFMSYEKLSGNTYRLTFKLYRDCFNGQADFDGTPTSSTAVASIGVFEINNTSYTLVTSYSLVNPVVTNISANAGLQNPFVTIPPDVCVEEGVYSYDFTIPDPTKSYILVYERCCRNNSITNLLNPGTQGSTYSVIINPQANNISNSSPQFSVYPPPFICANTFLAYDHSAVDPDGDSLVYSLCNVRSGASQNVPAPNPPNSPPYDTVTWNANYWYNSPMSTDSFEINPTSGLLTCTPTQLGQYLVGICISEYRSGQLISQYTRDFQFNVVGCPTMSNNTNYLPYTFDDNLKYGVYKANDSTLTVDFSGLIFHNPAPTNIPLKILWDFGVSSSNTDTSSLPNPIFTYPDTGSYLATVTITKEILGREMKVIGKGLINLGADSLLSDFSYMQTSGGLQNNINFTDKSFTLNKIVGWRWDFGDGQVSFLKIPPISLALLLTIWSI